MLSGRPDVPPPLNVIADGVKVDNLLDGAWVGPEEYRLIDTEQWLHSKIVSCSVNVVKRGQRAGALRAPGVTLELVLT